MCIVSLSCTLLSHYCLRHLLLFTCKQPKHVSMSSLLALRKPTYPQSFMLIYGFIFELLMLNLNKEKEKKRMKMKNSAHHSPIHL